MHYKFEESERNFVPDSVDTTPKIEARFGESSEIGGYNFRTVLKTTITISDLCSIAARIERVLKESQIKI